MADIPDMFNGLTNSYKKAEAAVVIQNLLAHQASVGTFHSDPVKSASTLVEATWRSKPDLFEGKFGRRPHKLAIAAAALAFGVANGSKDHQNRDGFVLALGATLSEYEINASLYSLNNVDKALFDDAIAVFTQLIEEERRKNPNLVHGL